jgi:prepilin peptidase CpaA
VRLQTGLAVVAVVMAISTVTDLRERRVPLWLTASTIAGGLLTAGTMGGEALRESAIGLVVGLLLLAPFVALGGIGMGDALLLGVVGTWLGWCFVLMTAWWGALAGGVLALVALLRKQRTFPYVPALAIGAMVAAVAGRG